MQRLICCWRKRCKRGCSCRCCCPATKDESRTNHCAYGWEGCDRRGAKCVILRGDRCRSCAAITGVGDSKYLGRPLRVDIGICKERHRLILSVEHWLCSCGSAPSRKVVTIFIPEAGVQIKWSSRREVLIWHTCRASCGIASKNYCISIRIPLCVDSDPSK